MFNSDGPAEQQQHSGGAGGGAGGGPGRPAVPVRGSVFNSRRPCLSQAGANPHHVPCASSACRTRMPPPPPQAALVAVGRATGDRSGDDDADKQYCWCHHHFPPSYFFILLLLPYMVPWWWCCESVCVCDWWTLANVTFFFFSDTGCPLACDAAKVPISGLHLELLRDPSFKTRIHFYLWPFLVLAHVPPQTFFDFNAVYILIE